MNKLIATVTLGVLTAGSFAIGLASQVDAAASGFRTMEKTITAPTFPNGEANTELSQTSEEMQIANVTWACNTYYDGSWECCAVDSNGNWVCRWGR